MPNLRELASWMTTGQAASRLSLSRQSVVEAAKDGYLRAAHVGSAYDDGKAVWVYDPDSVEDYRQRRARRREKERA